MKPARSLFLQANRRAPKGGGLVTVVARRRRRDADGAACDSLHCVFALLQLHLSVCLLARLVLLAARGNGVRLLFCCFRFFVTVVVVRVRCAQLLAEVSWTTGTRPNQDQQTTRHAHTAAGCSPPPTASQPDCLHCVACHRHNTNTVTALVDKTLVREQHSGQRAGWHSE